MPLITDEQVVLDLTGADRHEATRALAERLVASGRCTDLDTFLADVTERESKMATGLPGGIGIPHARSAAITEPSLVFGRSTDGIDWGAKDGPATLVFLIAAPEGGGDAHMQMLPKLARALMKKDFKAALAAATTEAEVVEHRRGPGRARPAEGRAAAAAARHRCRHGRRHDVGCRCRARRCRPPAATRHGHRRGRRPALAHPRRRHLLPDRHRAHLHGGRVARERREGGRPRHEGRDPGLGRHHAAQRRRDRRRRRGDLRPRPPGQGRRPVRRQADRRRRRQEGHLRRPGPHRGGRAHRRPVEGPPAAGGRGDVRRPGGAGRPRRRRSTTTPAPSPSCASG